MKEPHELQTPPYSKGDAFSKAHHFCYATFKFPAVCPSFGRQSSERKRRRLWSEKKRSKTNIAPKKMMVSNQKISFSRRLFSGGQTCQFVWSVIPSVPGFGSFRFFRLGHRLCSGGGKMGVIFLDLWNKQRKRHWSYKNYCWWFRNPPPPIMMTIPLFIGF